MPPITLPQPITGGRFAQITIAHQGWQETAALRDFGSAQQPHEAPGGMDAARGADDLKEISRENQARLQADHPTPS
jgi:hypothetical protein